MFGIIYKATSPSGKVYIGQTVRTLEKRIIFHVYASKDKKYKGCNLFQKAIHNYGSKNIKWEIIDEADSREELDSKEIHWINYYRSNAKKYWYKYGYNITSGGRQRSAFRLSDTHKKKIGAANRGRIFSEEIRKTMGCPGGKPSWVSGKTKDDFSKEHLDAIIQSQKRRRESPDYVPPMLGKFRTEEHKKIISVATKLAMQKISPEARARMSMKKTDEQKRLISEKTKLAMNNPEVKEKMRIARLKRIKKQI